MWQVESGFLNWAYEVNDVAVSPDGLVYVTAPVGVAWTDGAGEWTLIDVEGLPTGAGLEEGVPGRMIEQIAIGPDGSLWVAGYAVSHEDDEQSGSVSVDAWIDGRVLWWVARLDDRWPRRSWRVFTSNDMPELEGGIGGWVVSADGTLYASTGEDLLLVFDGTGWDSRRLPTGWAQGIPWSNSMTVGVDVLWAAPHGRGLVAYDPVSGFTRYTTEDGLPSDNIVRVSSAGDGTIWVATDALYLAPSEASPDVAVGVASFDGTTWTSYTMADGLVWNDGVVAAGPNGTVWTVHSGTPPHGYARLDGTTWTSYPFGQLPVGGSRSAVGPDGTLWTVSEDGLISFDGTTQTIHPSPFVQPEGSFTFTPVEWGIISDDPDWPPGVHTVVVLVDVRPLTADDVEDVSGRLIWDETVVDLCQVGFDRGDGFLQIGDIFQTIEGCGTNPTAMQDAFDEFGWPETACVTVTVGGLDHEYCAPLPVAGHSFVGMEPGTITVVLDGLEGFLGLDVRAWVIPIDLGDEWQRLGQMSFTFIDADPYSASQIMQTPDGSYQGEVASFEPGTYRFIIEAQYPSGNMCYGCEMPIQVIEGDPLIVTLSSIPTYTDSSFNWTPVDEVEYPDCRD